MTPGLSLFPNGKATTPEGVTLANIMRRIQSGEWKNTIEHCRELRRSAGDAAYKDYRTGNVPHFATHAIFKTRKAGLPDSERFAGFTGLMQIDLDGVPSDEIEPLREKAKASPHVAAAFTSPSGEGIKILVAAHTAESREQYIAIAKAAGRWAAPLFGREPDNGVLTDAARLCCVSFDPQAYFNPGATPLPWNGVPVGERHNTIKTLVCSLVARGVREDSEILERVRAVVPDDDKTDEEIIALADWARAREVSKEEVAKGLEVEAVGKFFYVGRQGYAMRNGAGFLPLPSESLVKSHLVDMGIPKSDLNRILCRIRTGNHAVHCGPLAGHPAGLHYSPEADGKILVTTGPRIIPAVQDEWPFLERFFREFADDPAQPDQLPALFAWLRQARKNLLKTVRRAFPALVLVSPKRAGKTFLIDLIRQCLGGRAANGYASLSGQTAFNADTVGAELLVCDDEQAHRDARTRNQLAQGLKSKLFAGAVRVEGKGRDAVNLRPIQAVVLAANSEPEHLAALPALDDSLADKLTIIRGAVASFDGLKDPEAIAAATTAALPGFLHFLETTETPDHLTDPRTGAAAWQHPAIREALSEIQPETRLLELLESCPAILACWQSGEPWQGSAQQLKGDLEADPRTRDTARGLLPFANTTGNYLARLESRLPERFSRRVLHGVTRWQITGPGSFEGENQPAVTTL